MGRYRAAVGLGHFRGEVGARRERGLGFAREAWADVGEGGVFRYVDRRREVHLQLENNYFTEMCSGSEAGSYSRLIDFVYHSTLGLRVIKKITQIADGPMPLVAEYLRLVPTSTYMCHIRVVCRA